jgi:hypothetical protein
VIVVHPTIPRASAQTRPGGLMMDSIRRYERRLLAGRPYVDPRDAVVRSMERRLATVQHLLAAAIVVAWLATRLGHAPVAVIAVVAAAVGAAMTFFTGGAVRDRIHATPAAELARRAAHVRAVDEAASVRCRPLRRELDLVMVATRPIERVTRTVLRREARELADRARRLRTTTLHAGVAVAELPSRSDGTVRWSARPRLGPGPDRTRWARTRRRWNASASDWSTSTALRSTCTWRDSRR